MQHVDVLLPDWARVLGLPTTTAQLRTGPEDFRVDEVLGFEPDGDGEHLMVQIRKRNRNTDQVARQLARHAGVPARDVSYCGLKDRIAVTTQWFSIWLPGKPDPDWSGFEEADVQVVGQSRHRRKLPRGALQGNRFQLVLRDLHGEREDLERRLHHISQQGVPNYFGEQRFGHEGRNLEAAQAMFAGRKIKDKHLRGLYLSAARSFLFNEVLSARVLAGNWDQALPGEALQLAGSHSFFVAENIDAEIQQRLRVNDIFPTGPLWGRGQLPCVGEARKVEETVLAQHEAWRHGLEQAGLKQERRALRLLVEELQWQWLDNTTLQLQFGLVAGAYATAVLRELIISAN